MHNRAGPVSGSFFFFSLRVSIGPACLVFATAGSSSSKLSSELERSSTYGRILSFSLETQFTRSACRESATVEVQEIRREARSGSEICNHCQSRIAFEYEKQGVLT